jgi:hypothetical protein
MSSELLWLLSITVICIQFINHWFYGNGKFQYSYPLAMIAFTIYIIIETSVAIRDPHQYALILFNITNIWGFIMALKGYLRIRKEHNAKFKLARDKKFD